MRSILLIISFPILTNEIAIILVIIYNKLNQLNINLKSDFILFFLKGLCLCSALTYQIIGRMIFHISKKKKNTHIFKF